MGKAVEDGEVVADVDRAMMSEVCDENGSSR
jgi:hypothetical protein